MTTKEQPLRSELQFRSCYSGNVRSNSSHLYEYAVEFYAYILIY